MSQSLKTKSQAKSRAYTFLPPKTCHNASFRGNTAFFRITGQELDAETGLYYFGARYLDPRTSRWMSVDPAVGEYVPVAPNSDEARRHNENLPGLGGVFNYVNMHVYHYGGNNPIKYVDPNGMWIDNEDGTFTAVEGDTLWGLYGEGWQEKSGFTRDPKTLQIGETVGFKRNDFSDAPSGENNVNAENSRFSLGNWYNNLNESTKNRMLGGGLATGGAFVFVGSLFGLAKGANTYDSLILGAGLFALGIGHLVTGNPFNKEKTEGALLPPETVFLYDRKY